MYVNNGRPRSDKLPLETRWRIVCLDGQIDSLSAFFSVTRILRAKPDNLGNIFNINWLATAKQLIWITIVTNRMIERPILHSNVTIVAQPEAPLTESFGIAWALREQFDE